MDAVILNNGEKSDFFKMWFGVVYEILRFLIFNTIRQLNKNSSVDKKYNRYNCFVQLDDKCHGFEAIQVLLLLSECVNL